MRSGFHAWLTRAPSQRSQDDEKIGARIRASHIGSYRTYGARRVWHDIFAEGYQCGLHKIERLMREQGLRARPRRRGLPKDQGERSVIAGNVLDRQFTADRPNQNGWRPSPNIWTAEGWLYLAAVIDLFSRRVVGWSMSDSMTAQLVTDALMMRSGDLASLTPCCITRIRAANIRASSSSGLWQIMASPVR